MIHILLSLLPIFLILVLGNLLRRNGFPSADFWSQSDRLVYWLMFPALLLHKTSTAPLTAGTLGPYAISLIGAMVVIGFVVLVMAKLAGQSRPAMGSVFQGAVRHNTFIAFAIAEALYGSEGLFYAALATAILVPPINVYCVVTLVGLQKDKGGVTLGTRLTKELLRNPLLIAIGLGVTLNLTGIGPIPVVDDIASILAKVTLPLALLGVGAGLRIRAIHVGMAAVCISSLGKLLLFPAITFAVIHWMGLTGVPAYVAALYGAAPTAVSGYLLAKQLGADAPLMAGIITIQTLLSMATLPIALMLAQQLFPA